MAGDVRALASLQRDAMLGEIPAPDIYYSALFAGPSFFADPRTHAASQGLVAGQVSWMRAISDTTDLRQAVAEARGSGATGIKLYAALSAELTRRITAEAHAQGMPVWAHAALRPAMPIDVVNAGVNAVSHASLVALAMDATRRAANLRATATQPLDLNDAGLDTTLQAMVVHHTVFEPTLFIFGGNAGQLRLAGEITRKAHQQGVTIIAGTDSVAGADGDSLALPNLHVEMELLVRLGGLTPAEALQSATRNAAMLLGIQASRGTIEVGKFADLVVLTADPLADIRNTRSIRMVIKRGRVYRRM
jgi:imidazolonepropionase-like amidohydrolase